MKAGVVDGFGCFPDRLPPERNSNTFIPDDFQHEIATNFLVRDKGLVVITSCSHRGVVDAVKQAQVVSGVQKVHAVIGGMHLVPPLTDDYIREAVANLKAINPDCIIPAHCTGETFYEIAKAEMPGKINSLHRRNTIHVCRCIINGGGESASGSGPNLPMWSGRARPLCPGISDIDLFGYRKASSTSMPRYLTVLSILVWPSRAARLVDFPFGDRSRLPLFAAANACRRA